MERSELTFTQIEGQVTKMASGLHLTGVGLIHFPPVPQKSR